MLKTANQRALHLILLYTRYRLAGEILPGKRWRDQRILPACAHPYADERPERQAICFLSDFFLCHCSGSPTILLTNPAPNLIPQAACKFDIDQ